MSLTVKILEFRLPKPKANLIGRVEFRGKCNSIFKLLLFFSSSFHFVQFTLNFFVLRFNLKLFKDI